MKLKKSMALYVHYDERGQLLEEARYYLENLSNIFEETWLISNGGLTTSSETIEFLKKNNINLLERDNYGYDFGGWKDAILKIGKAKLKSIETLCLCNSSCFGPIFPFADLFSKKSASEYDFWGLTSHPAVTGRFPEHIQSYFMVFNKKILEDGVFFSYWKDLKIPHSWEDAVSYETSLTDMFKKRGFRCGALFPTTPTVHQEPNITLLYAAEIIEDGCPLIKKKVFSEKASYFLEKGNAKEAGEAYKTVRKYNPDLAQLIEKALIVRISPSRLRNAINNCLILPNRDMPALPSDFSVGTICFVYYPELIDKTLSFLNSLDSSIDLCVVSSNEEILEIYRKRLRREGKNFFRIANRRGRNESAYFITCRDLLLSWNLTCFLHDKKTSHAPHEHMGECWMEHCFSNLFGRHVPSIINQFITDPSLGLLVPPPPLFAVWTNLILQNPWAGNAELGSRILSSLGFQGRLDEDPMAPYGGMFWARKEALLPLIELNLQIEDFPEEPLAFDGTFLHALERIYPQIAQMAGFKTSWILSLENASNYINNLYEELKKSVGKTQVVNITQPSYSAKEIAKFYLRKHPVLFSSAKRTYLFLKKVKKSKKKKTETQNNVFSAGTKPILLGSNKEKTKDFVLILPNVQQSSFSGGPNTALLFSAEFAKLGWNVKCLALSGPVCDSFELRNHIKELLSSEDERIATKFSSGMFDSNIALDPSSIICATATCTCKPAQDLFEKNHLCLRAPLYLIQDFEAGFYPWGDTYASALFTYFQNFIPVFNEKLLKEFFLHQPELRNSIAREDSFSFEPSFGSAKDVISSEVHSKKKKKILLFYGRRNAPRNLFETGVEALKILVKAGDLSNEKWIIKMIGEPALSPINLGKGMVMKAEPWLGYKEYLNLLREADCGLSLMLSPHTSYLPLELASCKIPVVTNTFANKTEDKLKSISSFIFGSSPDPVAISIALKKAIEANPNHLEVPELPSSWGSSFAPIVKKVIEMTSDVPQT